MKIEDLDLVIPITLHHIGPALREQAESEQEERNHRHQDDRDRHRQIAAQADPDISEEESQTHQSSPRRHHRPSPHRIGPEIALRQLRGHRLLVRVLQDIAPLRLVAHQDPRIEPR